MYHIIINPASRSGKGETLWKNTVKPYLIANKISYHAYFSKRPGDISRLAQKVSAYGTPDSPVQMVILGGDGTFNEALQGIQDFSSVILGYVPTGSSNDFARDLKLPKDPAKAVEIAFRTGTLHQMDIGCANFPDASRRYFAVSCGLGFDAAVCEETNRSAFKKTLNRIGLGKLAYLTIAVKQLLLAQTVSCEVSIDGAKPFTIPKYLLLACMNHRYEGGGFKFCPDAIDNDGIMDICSAANILPKWVILMVLPSAFIGKHFAFPGITPYKAKKLELKFSSPVWVHTDGEVLRMDDRVSITCLHKVLNIRY